MGVRRQAQEGPKHGSPASPVRGERRRAGQGRRLGPAAVTLRLPGQWQHGRGRRAGPHDTLRDAGPQVAASPRLPIRAPPNLTHSVQRRRESCSKWKHTDSHESGRRRVPAVTRRVLRHRRFPASRGAQLLWESATCSSHPNVRAAGPRELRTRSGTSTWRGRRRGAHGPSPLPARSGARGPALRPCMTPQGHGPSISGGPFSALGPGPLLRIPAVLTPPRTPAPHSSLPWVPISPHSLPSALMDHGHRRPQRGVACSLDGRKGQCTARPAQRGPRRGLARGRHRAGHRGPHGAAAAFPARVSTPLRGALG